MQNFTDTLGALAKGRALAEANEALAALVLAVQSTGKPGAVSVTITVAPNKGTLFVSYEIKSKAPVEKPPASIFYPDDEGKLHRRDPNQTEMPLSIARDRAQGE